jgi:hypothetical protein
MFRSQSPLAAAAAPPLDPCSVRARQASASAIWIARRTLGHAFRHTVRTSTPLAATARPRAWLRLPSDLLAPAYRVGRGRDLRRPPPRGLDPLGEQGRVDWSWASVDTMSVRAKREEPPGTNPVDLGKPGSKLHLAWDGDGLPLTAAVDRRQHTTMFAAVLDDVPPTYMPSPRRRKRPGKVHAAKGYDSRANRAWLRRRGISPRIARRGIESSARLGRHWWKVERSLSWLSCWRRLQMRWDRDSGRCFAFVLVACAVVCFNRL